MRIYIYRMDKGKFVKDVFEVDNIECLVIRTIYHNLPLKFMNRASKYFYGIYFCFELSKSQEKKLVKFWFK